MVVLQTLHAGGSTSTSTLPLSCSIFFHLVDAIQRVEKIKQRRQDRFVKNRSVLKKPYYICVWLVCLAMWCNVSQAEGRLEVARGGGKEGSGTRNISTARPTRCLVPCMFCDLKPSPPPSFPSLPLAITQKAREAQLQRQKDKDKTPAMEMETND
jgi:hypothetical protein